MKSFLACVVGVLLLGACRVSLLHASIEPTPGPGRASESPPPDRPPPDTLPLDTLPLDTLPLDTQPPDLGTLGSGATPGNARGPGGFVPRGSMRNFYAGAGGRLWYYMNNYYWVSPTTPREDLWIKAEVMEEFRDLRKWPDGSSVPSPERKVTVEYWEVGPTGRSVRLDNHKDYCLLSDKYSAGAIVVEVTLTLGHLEVKDKKDDWGPSKEAYVLESRNYRDGGGIGADRARFVALPAEAVSVWGYRVPWSTHPQRLTRSNWKRLELPVWSLLEKRPPANVPLPARVVTPRATEPEGS